jgi:hypothetical protein
MSGHWPAFCLASSSVIRSPQLQPRQDTGQQRERRINPGKEKAHIIRLSVAISADEEAINYARVLVDELHPDVALEFEVEDNYTTSDTGRHFVN